MRYCTENKGTPTGWFREEIERALNRQTKDRLFRVIPLILPGTDPALVDSFLELRTWVDFSAGLENEDSFHLLVSGIKGIPPGRFPREAEDEGQLWAPALVAQNSPVAPIRVELRSAPAVLSLDKVNAMLVRLDLFDRRLNASAHGVRHDYRACAVGNDVVVEDGATGLMWQKGGSAETMRFDEAEAYAGELAKSQFAGFSDWRVPTLEEGMTLMSPKPIEDMHIDRIFQRGVNFIWTSDQHSPDEGFVIYFFDGELYAETKQFNAWVRVVRRMDD